MPVSDMISCDNLNRTQPHNAADCVLFVEVKRQHLFKCSGSACALIHLLPDSLHTMCSH